MKRHTRRRAQSPGFFAIVAGLILFSGMSGLGTGRAAEPVLGSKLEKTPKTEAEVKAAIQRLQGQVKANPQNYRYHFELASWYQEGGDEEKAKTSYEKALELNPKYTEALVNLGGLYSDTGNFDEAITYFEKALALNPGDCKARSNLGNAYYSLERYPDAMYEYMRAVDQDDKCYSALYNVAVAFADAGLFREAVIWWERVIRSAPGTDAAQSARENIEILRPFTSPPPSSVGGAGRHE